MSGHRQKRIICYDAFYVDKIIFDGQNSRESEYFMVDIAGGGGYDLSSFVKRFLDTPGSLVV